MGELLLVAATPAEESTLVEAVPTARSVSPAGLAVLLEHRSAAGDVDAVVVGTSASAPLDLVRSVHRATPLAGVLVLTTEVTDADVRRSASYALDMPASLAVVESTAPDLVAQVREVADAGRAQRRHHETLAAVSSRERVTTPHALAPATLGALLDHAPFGVLVGDLDGGLVTWNRWAGDLLALSNDATGRPIPSLFPTPELFEASFALARAGSLEEASTPVGVVGPGDAEVEVVTAPTLLEDGRDAVLVLVQDVTTRRQAERTRDVLAEHVGLLGRVSEALAGTLDVDRALGRLSDELVPTFADWVSLQTYDQRGVSRRVVVRHRDPDLDREAARERTGLLSRLADTAPSRRIAAGGGPVLLESITQADLDEFVGDAATRDLVRRLGATSAVAVPVPGRDAVLGSMVLVRGPGSPDYTPQDLAVGVEVGRRAGVALDTVALYARQRDLAAELQRSLLTEPPRPEQAEIVVRYVAAAEEAQVGGDWYDAFVQEQGGTVLIIGDVMGHDMRAAAAMGQLRALLRGIGYTTGTGPAEMLSRLDAAIEGLGVQTTATGLVVRVEPRAPGDTRPASLCWSNAGHPPPIMVRPGHRPVVLEHDDPDLLLGVLAHIDRQESGASLEPGATLLLYTDGLIERRGESLDEGLSALTSAVDRLAGLPLPQMCDQLLVDLLPENNDDDVALVAVRLHA